MNDAADNLDGIALFAGMEAEERDALLGCRGARIVSRSEGAVLFCEGSRADRFGVVLAGSLVVVREDADGRRTLVKRIVAGGLVAAAQAFSATRTMSVRVEADEPSRVLVMNADRVIAPCERACAFHVKLVRNLMRLFAEKTLDGGPPPRLSRIRRRRGRLARVRHPVRPPATGGLPLRRAYRPLRRNKPPRSRRRPRLPQKPFHPAEVAGRRCFPLRWNRT